MTERRVSYDQDFFDRLETELKADMAAHGAPLHPRSQLFPKQPSNFSDETELATSLMNGTVIGVSQKTAEYIYAKGPIPSVVNYKNYQVMQCPPGQKTAVADNGLDIFRLATGLHETVHGYNFTKNIIDGMVETLEKKGVKNTRLLLPNQPGGDKLLPVLAEEGLSEGAATRFMLMRYGDDPRILKGIQTVIHDHTASKTKPEYKAQHLLDGLVAEWKKAGSPQEPDYKLSDAIAHTAQFMTSNPAYLDSLKGMMNGKKENPATQAAAKAALCVAPTPPKAKNPVSPPGG